MLQGYYKFACGLSFLFLCLFGQETGDNTRGVIVGGFCCLFCGYRGTSLHKTTPAPKSYPSVRGDLINCFSTLLLLWRKSHFFIFGSAQYFHHLRIELSIFHSLHILYSCFFYCDFYLLLCVYYMACFGVLSSAKLRRFTGWLGCL